AVATMRRALPRLPLQTRHPARCQDPKKVSSPLLPCPLKRFAPQPVRWFPLDRNSCALADRIRHSEALPQSFDPAPAQTRPGLSLKSRIWFGLLFFIIPYACVLVSSTLYYAWRKEKPAQARQIN